MKKESRIKILFIILWVFLVVSFTILAFFVLSEATGYRFNWKTFRSEMTGLISLDGSPKNVEINVNGKIQNTGLPVRLTKIFPGQYEIIITKEGYSPWSKLFNVAGGQALEEKKIYLYYLNPQIAVSTSYSAEQISNIYKNQASKVIFTNNEIWYQQELISRFTGIIQGAILTNDRKHIIFQLGKELRVVELNGKNNTKLINLPTSDKLIFALIDDNKIAYIDQNKVYEAQIH